MRPLFRVALCVSFVLSNLSCSVNVLENFADKNTNEALFYDAKKLINAGEFQAALAKFALMSDEFEARREIVYWKSTAHAGICGLRFLPLIKALGDMGSATLFQFLVSHFRASSSDTIDSCIEAETLVNSLGTTATRTTDENILMALIGLAKMGAVMSFYGDLDQDGVVATSYDVCVDGPDREAGDPITEEDIRQFGTGLTSALNNIAAAGDALSAGGDSLGDMTAACAALEAEGGAAANFCAVTDPDDFSALHLLAIRSLLKEGSAVGLNLGTCAGNGVSDGNCECLP